MSYLVILVTLTFVGFGIALFKKKGIPFFEPAFREGYPDECKPFFEMEKCRIHGSAYPRHTVLPILEKITEKEEALSGVEIDVVSYNFNYEGYNPDDNWYKALAKVLEKSGRVKLVGGLPTESRRSSLEELSKKGAEIRYLDHPPKTHIFLYECAKKPLFIWFENEHRGKRATCIAYTTSPSDEDGKHARDFFNNVWNKGKTAINN